MKTKLCLLSAAILAFALCRVAVSQDMQTPDQYCQIAEIEIDPAQLEQYKAAVKEHIETAVRVEPGVLMLYALSDKDNPTHIRVFEIYASEEAYKAHLNAPHFKKYKAVTQNMVQSLKLIKVAPVAFAAKPK